MNKKRVLDATAGARMMWFDKENPETIFVDIRSEEIVQCDGRVLSIAPDYQADFRRLPFDDESFFLVVFDPPHLIKLGGNTFLAQKYGRLLTTWEDDIKEGFDECLRVLKPNGTLIFKWNEHQINLPTVLKVIQREPLFGHTSGKHGKTKWMTFLK